MLAHPLEIAVTDGNFDEEAYLRANGDVARAVREGHVESGRAHFEHFGRNEGRMIRVDTPELAGAKERKLTRIKPLLRTDLPCVDTAERYDFLSSELRAQFNIVDTEAVSSNHYDPAALDLITRNADGLVLDCGAGKRPVYFENVVNFEIVDYDTTDVRGVGEVLPFVDEAFDAVISIAVLEHVKDPFLCAREISRVLKPGGSLICCVPFLQPLHGYPHHYYNMSGQGLGNLFADFLALDNVTVLQSVLPIWSLTWILRSWTEGLRGDAKEQFMQMRVADLVATADKYLDRPFVTELSEAKNLELASATVLFAHKK